MTGLGEPHGLRGISKQFVPYFQRVDRLFTHLPLFIQALSIVLITGIHADSILSLSPIKRRFHGGGGGGTRRHPLCELCWYMPSQRMIFSRLCLKKGLDLERFPYNPYINYAFHFIKTKYKDLFATRYA